MVEAIIVLFLLVGLFATVLFFGKLGNMIQMSHMGARVLAFNAGDKQFAWPKNPNPPQVKVEEPKFNLSSLQGEARAKWEDMELGNGTFLFELLKLLDGTRSACITDVEKGKIAGGEKMVAPISVPYRASYEVIQNSWKISEWAAEGLFFLISSFVVSCNKSLKDLGGERGQQISIPGDVGKYTPGRR